MFSMLFCVLQMRVQWQATLRMSYICLAANWTATATHIQKQTHGQETGRKEGKEKKNRERPTTKVKNLEHERTKGRNEREPKQTSKGNDVWQIFQPCVRCACLKCVGQVDVAKRWIGRRRGKWGFGWGLWEEQGIGNMLNQRNTCAKLKRITRRLLVCVVHLLLPAALQLPGSALATPPPQAIRLQVLWHVPHSNTQFANFSRIPF